MNRKIQIDLLLVVFVLIFSFLSCNNEEKSSLIQTEGQHREGFDSVTEAISFPEEGKAISDSISLTNLKQLHAQEKRGNREKSITIRNQQFLIAIGSIAILVLVIINIAHRLKSRKTKDGRNILKQKDIIIKNKDKTILQYQVSLKKQLDMYKDLVELSLSPRAAKYSRFLTDYNQIVYNREGVLEFSWEVFDILFTRAYSDCAEKLRAKYPELTDKEAQVVLLQKGGFDISTIAEILKLSIHTIYRRNSDVRKKIGVPDSENLIKYLDEQFK